jgi:hypothetical protein
MKYSDFKKAVAEKAGISVYKLEKEIRNGYKPYTTAEYLSIYPEKYFIGRESYLASIIEELIDYEVQELKYYLADKKTNAEEKLVVEN